MITSVRIVAKLKPNTSTTAIVLARRAKEKGIENVVFDRAGYLYHGRIRALADSARETGLKF